MDKIEDRCRTSINDHRCRHRTSMTDVERRSTFIDVDVERRINDRRCRTSIIVHRTMANVDLGTRLSASASLIPRSERE